MMMNTPDAYRILLIDTDTSPLIKVFASWSSSYLYGDSWKLNSGTEVITEDDTHYFFHGYSGSIYKLRKDTQGSLTSYTSRAYNRILEKEGVKEISLNAAIDILKGE